MEEEKLNQNQETMPEQEKIDPWDDFLRRLREKNNKEIGEVLHGE